MTTLLLASDTLLTIAVATAAVTGVSIVILETALWVKRRRARAADVAGFGADARPMTPTEEAARSARREATRRRSSRPVPQAPAEPSAKQAPASAAQAKPATTRKVKTEPSRAASAPRAATTAGAVVPKAFAAKDEQAPSRPVVSDMPIVSAPPVRDVPVVDTVDDASAYDFTHRARSYRPAAVRHEPSGLVDSVAIPVVPPPLIVGQGDESEEELAALAAAAEAKRSEETRRLEKLAAEAAIASRRAEAAPAAAPAELEVPEIRAGIGALSTRKPSVEDVTESSATEEEVQEQSVLAAAAFMEMRASLIDSDDEVADDEETSEEDFVAASESAQQIHDSATDDQDDAADETEDETDDEPEQQAESSPMTGLTDLVEQGLAGVSAALAHGDADEATVAGLEETLEELVRLTDNALLPSASATLRLVPAPEEQQPSERLAVQDQSMAASDEAPIRVFDSLRIDRVSLASEEVAEDATATDLASEQPEEQADEAPSEASILGDAESPMLLDGSVVDDETDISRPSDSMVLPAVSAEVPTDDSPLVSDDQSDADDQGAEPTEQSAPAAPSPRASIRPIPYASSSRVPVPPRDPEDPESFDLIQLGRRSAALRRVIVEEEARESARSPQVVDESVYDLHRQPLRIVRSDSNPAIRIKDASDDASEQGDSASQELDAELVPTSQRIDLSVPVEVPEEDAVVDTDSMDAPVIETEEPIVEDVKVMVPADLLEPGMGEDPDENPRPRGRSRRGKH